MRSHLFFGRSSLDIRTLLAVLPALAMLHSAPANATFHLTEITKVLVGVNGNGQAQAVELKMLAAGENLFATGQIRVYDAGGTFVDSLGTFTANVGSGAGRFVLCATHNFAATFGIVPDLIIKPGLLVGTGQVSFEKAGCLVNALAYGSVITPKNGTTSAAALPSDAATALVRTIEDTTVPSCPLGEDAAARFSLVSGDAATPIVFHNNAGASVSVFPTASGVDGGAAPPFVLRVHPNPFGARATIVAPGYGFLGVYDVRGRLVRRWGSRFVVPRVMGPMTVDWDGTDTRGNRLPSGIYFVQYGQDAGNRARVVLLR
jgi:hypothetical protein